MVRVIGGPSLRDDGQKRAIRGAHSQADCGPQVRKVHFTGAATS